VAFIIGISGACRREELMKMTINDIEDKQTVFIIKIPDTKNGMERIFTILNPNSIIDYLSYIRKYMALRPPHADTPRFFLKYGQNKCTKQPVGINSFGKMPSAIAAYLNLPNPELYTGHSFRRSSATMLASSGGDLIAVKKHGGWKSSSVAEGYIDSTMSTKINVSTKILSDNPSCSFSSAKGCIDDVQAIEVADTPIDFSPSQLSKAIEKIPALQVNNIPIGVPENSGNMPTSSTSNSVVSTNTNDNVICENSQIQSTLRSQGLQFNHCSHCTFNIQITHQN
jgi:hypothetical protein